MATYSRINPLIYYRLKYKTFFPFLKKYNKQFLFLKQRSLIIARLYYSHICLFHIEKYELLRRTLQ